MILPSVALAGEAAPRVPPSASYDVTFAVPLNLTRLTTDITQVDITCSIQSDAILPTRTGTRGAAGDNRLAGHLVLNVSQGRVVTTASVVVPVPAASLQAPAGRAANYQCILTGYSTGTRSTRAGWSLFEERNANPSFRLSPSPQPITGNFVW